MCKPNNFAMIPRIARSELSPEEYYLYGTIVDLAIDGKLTRSNKKMAELTKVKSVNTYKERRDSLHKKGYIRLFYLNLEQEWVELSPSQEAKTFGSIRIELVDIWDMNQQFVESKTSVGCLSFLQNCDGLLSHFQSPLPIKGVKEMIGGYQCVDRGVSIERQGGVKEMIGGCQQADSNIRLSLKTVLKDLDKRKKIKDTSRYARIQFFASLIDALVALDLESKQETATEQSIILPDSNQEQNHITRSIWDPVTNTYHVPQNFACPEKTYSDKQKMSHVIMAYFDCNSWGMAGRMVEQFDGRATGKRGGRNLIEPTMPPEEICVFGHWLCYEKNITISSAETIWEQATLFRDEPLYQQYLEFAPCLLNDLLARYEFKKKPEEEVETAPFSDEVKKAIAGYQAQSGIALFGET